MAGAQQFEKIEPALRLSGAEPGKMLVADLCADAIGALVTSAGVIHRNPGCTLEAGPKHVAGLIEKAVLAGDQQPPHLPLGDIDADGPQLRHQPWHRDLPLVILGQCGGARLATEMPDAASRERGD